MILVDRCSRLLYDIFNKIQKVLRGRVTEKEFPTGGIVRDPRKAADLVKLQNRQYSLDERRYFKMQSHYLRVTALEFISGLYFFR